MFDLSHKIESFEQNSLEQNTISLENLQQQLHTEQILSNHLKDLNLLIGRISRRYSPLTEYINPKKTYENFTLNDFASSCVSVNDGVIDILEQIHSLIIPEKVGFKNYNLLKLMAEYLKVSQKQTNSLRNVDYLPYQSLSMNLIDILEKYRIQQGYKILYFQGRISTHCSAKRSHQYLLYDLFNSIAVTEIKGFSLMQFSYALLRLHGHGRLPEIYDYTGNSN